MPGPFSQWPGVKPSLQGIDQRYAGAGAPFAVFRGGLAIRHSPIACKAPEVVYADNVIHLARAVYTAYPPAEAVRLHFIPIVQRIAPELAFGAEVVRRHPGYFYRQVLLVQLEELGLRPHVSGIHGNVYGYVAYYAYTEAVYICLQLCPLLKEQVLDVSEKLYILPEQLTVFRHCRGLSQAYILVLPLRP